MGLFMAGDGQINLLDGDFSVPGSWDVRQWWTIAGGKLSLDRLTAIDNSTRQFNRGWVKGNTYRFTVNIDSADFINEPIRGLRIGLGLLTSPIWNTPGPFVWDVIYDGVADVFFVTTNSTDIGDQAVIDSITVENLGFYVINTLEINYAPERRGEVVSGVLTDEYSLIASRRDATNCLISYNK